MKLIVGLGNPGGLYRDSRHNIGIQAVRALAKEYGIRLTTDKSALFKKGRGQIEGENIILAQTLVFMNLSGESVSVLLKKYNLSPENLLVICDDIDLELGAIRIKPAGSSGGHKGLVSVIEHLKSDSFARLRIGIGRPAIKNDIKDFVLSKFTRKEKDILTQILRQVIACSGIWARQEIKEAMNKFNRKRKDNEKL